MVRKAYVGIFLFLIMTLSCKEKAKTDEAINQSMNSINVFESAGNFNIGNWAKQNGFKFREDRNNALIQPTVSKVDIFDFNIFVGIPEATRQKISYLSFNSETILNSDYSLFPSLASLFIANCRQIDFTGLSRTKIAEIVVSRFSDTFFVSIKNLSELPLCDQLTVLYINCDEISSIESIKNCKSLEKLRIHSVSPFVIPKDLSKLTKLKELSIGYDGMTNFAGIETIPSTFKFTISSLESIKDASLEALCMANLSSLKVHETIYNDQKAKIDEVVERQKMRNPNFTFQVEDY